MQTIATDTLRKGLIEYDRRKGWRGAIANRNYNSNWQKDFNEYRLENSINWKISIVKKVDQFSSEIENQDGLKGTIDYNDITWTKKQFNELLKPGDIIFTEHLGKNKFSLKQIPKINGGIVVMDPYTGRVMALSGGFSFKNSEFNRASQALRQRFCI